MDTLLPARAPVLPPSDRRLTVVEVCAGGGGQALGVEAAGFDVVCAVDWNRDAVDTLRANRGRWTVACEDVTRFDPTPFRAVTLLSGGVPCQPFSQAGHRLGPADERDMFPCVLDMVEVIRPAAVMLENVPGLASSRFTSYRRWIDSRLATAGYETAWQVVSASSFGVPQTRSRCVLVALRPEWFVRFTCPRPQGTPPTVGQALHPFMAADGWAGADRWAAQANGLAPTIVGGSTKHGGADLGPSHTRRAWARLGVDGRSIADSPPSGHMPTSHTPRLTLPMVARLQCFPSDWQFRGGKTSVYRQIGNALPPPVAFHIALAIREAVCGRV